MPLLLTDVWVPLKASLKKCFDIVWSALKTLFNVWRLLKESLKKDFYLVWSALKSSMKERFNVETGRGMLHWLFSLFLISIPIAIICFNRVVHVGHHTEFPPDDVRQGFTEGCDSRGTINIVWACFSTIFTCVYVSLHLDVPYREREPRGWIERILAVLKSFGRKALWIIMNIVAPELIAYVAVIEFTNARKMRKHMTAKLDVDDAVWTLEHQFFADMGGFKVPKAREGQETPDSANDDVTGTEQPSTNGNLEEDTGTGISHQCIHHPIWHGVLLFVGYKSRRILFHQLSTGRN